MPEFDRTFARFPASEWERAAIEAGISCQTVRSPEEALTDPLLVADGAVTELDDPEVGRIRQLGRLWRFQKCDWKVRGPAPAAGQHTDEVKAEAAAAAVPKRAAKPAGRSPAHPLEGVRVIDFSLAVAGPFGAQVLAELGAEVIKVNAANRMQLNAAMHGICERSKRSIAIDLKDPDGMAVFHRLVESADVVATNMREAAVERLGLNYEAVRAINPRIIYCHTRGHEDGPRKNVMGHDQSAACIAGVEWLEGGLDDGGKPHWPSVSIGDTGNGFLWAAAVVQALYHRDRTGEGQKVDTAIVNAHLLNASMAWTTPDGSVTPRPKLDHMALGWNALYRLYECSDGWLCVAALSDAHWTGLCAAIDNPELAADSRFATAEARAANDAELAKVLEAAFSGTSAADAHKRLDAGAVPAEISSPDYILRFFEDPKNHESQRLTTFEDPIGGRTTNIGLLVDFSETPGKYWGPPVFIGEFTREIMRDVGYDDEQIDKLSAQGSVTERSR
jgi:crotonobetainyl-CoA:carnitine CoA-transferase CaiB-like acyl-CoA transferase